MKKFIDNKTFEILDEVFEVDAYIAKTISILNKKGYHTLFSCSGHVKDFRLYEKYHIENYDINNKESYDIDSYFVSVNGNSCDILRPYTYTAIYIKFDKIYDFECLPDGFKILEDDKTTIEKIIDYYDGDIKKDPNDIEKEIKYNNELLTTWAEKLKCLNDKSMVVCKNIKDSLEDLDYVMELIYKEWGNFFSSSKEEKINKIKRSIHEDKEFPQMYVLKEGNDVVGSFTFKETDLENCDLSPWLACVVIDKKYRGKGYGGELLKFVESIANEKYPTLYLTTQLIGYYERIGFEFVKNVEHNGEIDRLYKREIRRE